MRKVLFAIILALLLLIPSSAFAVTQVTPAQLWNQVGLFLQPVFSSLGIKVNGTSTLATTTISSLSVSQVPNCSNGLTSGSSGLIKCNGSPFMTGLNAGANINISGTSTVASNTFVYTVCSSGCDFNGSTDTAINSALLAASTTGGTILVKHGTYNLSNNVNVLSNEILMGEGYGTELIPTSTVQIMLNGVTNAAVKDMRIDGTNQSNVDLNNDVLVRVKNSTNVDLIGNTVTNSNGFGFFIESSNGNNTNKVRVVDNYLQGRGHQDVIGGGIENTGSNSSTSNVSIIGNDLIQDISTGGTYTTAFDMTGIDGVIFSNNNLQGNAVFGFEQSPNTLSQITNNVLRPNKGFSGTAGNDQIVVQQSTTSSTTTSTIISLLGNTIEGGRIYVKGNSAGHIQNVIVANNNIRAATGNDFQQDGIDFEYVDNSVVEGNSLTKGLSNTTGISFANSTNVQSSNNIINGFTTGIALGNTSNTSQYDVFIGATTNISGGGASTYANATGVGIGTTNPQGELQVAANVPGAQDWGQITASDASTPTLGVTIYYDHTNDRGVIAARNAGIVGKDLFLGSPFDLNAVLIQHSTGNVGLGTLSPNFKLEVNGTASTTNLQVPGTATTGKLTLLNVASGTQCLHANSSGQVTGTGADCGTGSGGLGTTSPFSAGYVPEATGTNVTLSNSQLFQTTAGNMAIGTTTSLNALTVAVAGTTNLAIINTTGTGSGGGGIYKAYSGTLPTAQGDRLGGYLFGYSDNITERNAVGVFGYADQAWTAGSIQGSYFTIETTPDGSASRFERLRVTAAGLIGIGTSTPIAKLSVLASTTDASIPEFVVASSSGAINFQIAANGVPTLAGVSNCTGTQFLQISSGLFGCGTPVGGGGGSGGGWATSTPYNIINTFGTQVGINSSTPTGNLVVQGIAGSTTPEFVVSSSTNAINFQVASNGSTTVANLNAGGVVQSTISGALYNSAVALGSQVSGVLPVANGGTGTSTSPTQQGQVLIADGTGAKYTPGIWVNTSTFTFTTSTVGQISGAVVKVPNAVTFNNSGSGAASGQTFDGSSAVTVSYNTIGAQVAGAYVTSVSGSGSVLSSGGATPTIQLQNLTANDILFGQGNNTIATSTNLQFTGGNTLAVTGSTTISNLLNVSGASTLATTSATSLSDGQIANCTNGVITGAAGIFQCNGSAFLTGNQTITLTGDVTGSGATSITTTYNNVVPVNKGGTGTSTAPTVTGQILAADGTGVKYAPTNLVAGSNITITTSTPGQITIAASGSLGSNFWTQNGNAIYNNTGYQVGINSSTPIANLVVEGSSTASTIPIFMVASSSNTSFFTVLANGNVGINSSTPATALGIVGNVVINGNATATVLQGTNQIITKVTSGCTNPGYTFSGSGSNYGISADLNTNFALQFCVTGVERFRIDTSGGFRANAPGSNSLPTYGWSSTNGDLGSGMYAPASGSLALTSNSVQRIVFDNNGNAGINSSTPNGTLVIRGYSGSTAPDFVITSSSNVSLFKVNANGSTTISSLGTGPVFASSGSLYIGSNNASIGTTTIATFNFVGQGSAVTNGATTTPVRIPFLATITGYSVSAPASCSGSIDIWKAAGAVPTSANTITGTALPTLSSQQITNSYTLTGWTTSVSNGDYIMAQASSTPTCTGMTLVLEGTR